LIKSPKFDALSIFIATFVCTSDNESKLKKNVETDTVANSLP